MNVVFVGFDESDATRHHAAGYALIANRIAADTLRDRDRDRAARELAAGAFDLGAPQNRKRGRR